MGGRAGGAEDRYGFSSMSGHIASRTFLSQTRKLATGEITILHRFHAVSCRAHFEVCPWNSFLRGRTGASMH